MNYWPIRHRRRLLWECGWEGKKHTQDAALFDPEVIIHCRQLGFHFKNGDRQRLCVYMRKLDSYVTFYPKSISAPSPGA